MQAVNFFTENEQIYDFSFINPLSDNFTKWSNTLKQFVCNLATNCLSVFDHFVGLALKGLKFLTATSTHFHKVVSLFPKEKNNNKPEIIFRRI